MPIYQVTKQEFHIVVKTFIEEFDTSDQVKWDHLMKLLSESGNDRISEFPSRAPEDPHLWFALLQQIQRADYEIEVEDDWLSLREGGYEVIHYLEDEYGEVIESAESTAPSA